MTTSDALRRAVADLAPRERAALGEKCRQAGERWAEHLPHIGAVWSAFADLVADVDRLDRARRAAHLPAETMRPMRRPRA